MVVGVLTVALVVAVIVIAGMRDQFNCVNNQRAAVTEVLRRLYFLQKTIKNSTADINDEDVRPERKEVLIFAIKAVGDVQSLVGRLIDSNEIHGVGSMAASFYHGEISRLVVEIAAHADTELSIAWRHAKEDKVQTNRVMAALPRLWCRSK